MERTEPIEAGYLPAELEKVRKEGYFIKLYLSENKIFGIGFKTKKLSKEEKTKKLKERLSKYKKLYEATRNRLKELNTIDENIFKAARIMKSAAYKKLSFLEDKIRRVENELNI